MNRLRLIAMDEEDLKIVSAHVQDAVVKAGDLAFDKQSGKFALALNRFVWENETGKRRKGEKPERRRAMLHFERVQGVRSVGIHRASDEQVLSLLSIGFDPLGAEDDPAGYLELVFAGDAELLLEVECIEARLTDTDASWAAAGKPDHALGREGR